MILIQDRGWGEPNHTTAQKLWYSVYYTPFTGSSLQEMGVGWPKSYDNTATLELYILILYSFTGSSLQEKGVIRQHKLWYCIDYTPFTGSFLQESGWEDPNHTTAKKLWYYLFYTPFTRSSLQERGGVTQSIRQHRNSGTQSVTILPLRDHPYNNLSWLTFDFRSPAEYSSVPSLFLYFLPASASSFSAAWGVMEMKYFYVEVVDWTGVEKASRVDPLLRVSNW